jgi:hypothetical protein
VKSNGMRMRQSPIPASARRLTAFGCLLLALGPLAGGASGGAEDYPSPLHLSGTPSSLGGSDKLVANPGPSSRPAPTAAVQPGGSMTIGSYTYAYTIVDAGGESAPSGVSNTQTTSAGNQQMLVTGLPATGTWRLYRRRSSLYFFVAERTNQATYTDTAADPPSATALPQSQNRVRFSFPTTCTMGTNCGWAEFQPRVPVDASTNSPLSATAPTAPTGKGWMLDAAGGVHFAAGSWTFEVQTRSGAATSGTAHLAAGLWKVTTGGTAVGGPLVDPGTAGMKTDLNLIDSTNAAKTVTHTVALPAFTLEAGERLYLQFWRHQAAAYTVSGTTDSRVITLYAHDGVARVVHPAVSTLPNAPVLGAPAEGAVTSVRTHSASFSDPDAGDAGSLEFRICTAPAAAGVECSSAVDSGASATIANGGSGSWTSTAALAHGVTYHWQARAVDALGGRSAWTATRSFVLNDAPAGAVLSRPTAGAYVRSSSPVLQAAFQDPDGDSGNVRFRVCRSATEAGVRCDDGVASGVSGLVATGAIASWSSATALRDGVYHWQARSEDSFGDVSPWSATRQVVVARRLIAILSERRLVCTVGARLSAHVRLARRADVTARLYTRSRFDLARPFGSQPKGEIRLAFRLSYALERPAIYWVRWRATRGPERHEAWMRVELRRAGPGVPRCRPDLS